MIAVYRFTSPSLVGDYFFWQADSFEVEVLAVQPTGQVMAAVHRTVASQNTTLTFGALCQTKK